MRTLSRWEMPFVHANVEELQFFWYTLSMWLKSGHELEDSL